MRPRLLITDDERDLLDTLYYNFKKENYDVYTASSGKEAIEILDKQPIDLAILDIMLPDMSGLDICKHIKINRNQSHTAVIMLTAKGEEIDRILGFELGADDYVVKPFSMRELTLRVSSLIKRNEDKNKDNKIIFGDISINFDSHIVKISDQTIKLTIKEFNLSRLLAGLALFICLFTNTAFSSEKNITYMQILQKPNDLDLNLKYAQQQGKMGNFKQTISTLERLNMLYPENVEIKLYLLSNLSLEFR